MYKDIETETSYNYLKKVLSQIDEPICLLGGWAVFLTVNKQFQKENKRPYLGSRDIDLGFNTLNTIKKAMSILEKELGFEFLSFRYFKSIHSETGKPLNKEQTRSMPQHSFFPLYVDIILSETNKEIVKSLGFNPVDEPLLKLVFQSKEHRKEIKEFNRLLWIPSPEVLLATKFNSIVNRDKQHKLTKDLCDIIALCIYSGEPLPTIIAKARKISHKDIKPALTQENIKRSAAIIGISETIVKQVIGLIK